MKQERRIHSLTAITLLISGLVFILWAVSMYCITRSVAQQNYELMLYQSKDLPDEISSAGCLNRLYKNQGLYGLLNQKPGFIEYCMLEAIQYAGNDGMRNLMIRTPEESKSFLRRPVIPLQTAVIFYDRNFNVLLESGNHLYFRYVTDDVWNAEQEERTTSGDAWINLGASKEDDPYAYLRKIVYSFDVRALRITGYMKGSEIVPIKLDYVTRDMIYEALDIDGRKQTSHVYTVSGLDHDGLFKWQNQFDNSTSVENTEDLVTIYGIGPHLNTYNAGNPVEYHGQEYDNLLALLSATAKDSNPLDGNYNYTPNKYSLHETILFEKREFLDLTNYDSQSGEPLPPPEFIMFTAISSHPLKAAVSQLRTVYIVTFLLTVLGVLILRDIIKRNLTRPVEMVNSGIAGGWSMYSIDDRLMKWLEPFELNQHYSSTSDTLRLNKIEITRLNTALEYAKEAERNRRQMTSNIAHELKTPLAIIHSYSEGLKEHIAEEKRERYLDVILSESERMDAMVLEMLDLSRLEAGKVKLAPDTFSLNQLTKTVFDKLSALAEEKKLKITFDLAEKSSVIADESRIEQVVMNFASNAVQYTPQGGNVLVRTYSRRSEVGFSVKNDGVPFTNEELSKVWETFYRADKSRNGKGTGLGLTIAKSIIDLHSGKCSVRNTSTGVVFSFTLPK